MPGADERVVGVLLAAGTGSRFKAGNKLLAEFEGDPVVVRAARSLCEADLDEVAAVLGFEAGRVGAALADLPVELLTNPAFAEGQSTSVGRGAAWAADRDAAAAVFALGDMPAVSPATSDALVDRWRETGASVVVPEHRGQRGNPVLFDAVHFDALQALEGDVGGRPVLRAAEDLDRVPVDDPGVLRDVDRVGDLEDGSP